MRGARQKFLGIEKVEFRFSVKVAKDRFSSFIFSMESKQRKEWAFVEKTSFVQSHYRLLNTAGLG